MSESPHFHHHQHGSYFRSGFLISMVLTTVNLKRFLRIKHFLAYVARNLLSFLMCHADMKRQIVSSKIFFGTRRNGTFKIFNLCMSL